MERNQHEVSGRLLLNGSPPLRSLGLIDAVSVAYALLLENRDDKERATVIAQIQGIATASTEVVETLDDLRTRLKAGSLLDPTKPKMPTDGDLASRMAEVARMKAAREALKPG